MKITYDPAKREATLFHRNLDFADAEIVFQGQTATIEDTRFTYPERRFLTAGDLDGRLMVIVWTPAPDGPDHFHEACPCKRSPQMAWKNGLIPMTRLN